MYRAVTLAVLRAGTDLADEVAVAALARRVAVTLDETGRVFLDGCEVTRQIRTGEIDGSVSLVARIPAVREEMVRQQRAMAAAGGVVMDGRDIGTTVLPAADCKIFLTASLAERTQRRYDELIKKGEKPDYVRLMDEIRRRDRLDSERECSPLRQAAGAAVVDTTGKTVEAVLAELLTLCQGE
jgi:cytidylate kinase